MGYGRNQGIVMSFKSWWESLGQPGPLAKKYTEDNTGKANLYSDSYRISDTGCKELVLKGKQEEFNTKDRNALYNIITKLLLQKNTFTELDFENQIDRVITASKAQEALKTSRTESNSIIDIVNNNMYMERAKLKAMIYNDINMSPEAAEEMIRVYI